MREHRLVSPSRRVQAEPNLQDGTMIRDKPNEIWGTDAIKIHTVDDGMLGKRQRPNQRLSPLNRG